MTRTLRSLVWSSREAVRQDVRESVRHQRPGRLGRQKGRSGMVGMTVVPGGSCAKVVKMTA